MATPSKLSWSKRKEGRKQRIAPIVISDSEDDKENDGELENSFEEITGPRVRRLQTPSGRRESTILAGNISYQGSLASYNAGEISYIHNPKSSKSKITTNKTTLPTQFETEPETDESDFQSCKSSPDQIQEQELHKTWMTDISTKSKRLNPSKPVEQTPQIEKRLEPLITQRSTVKKSAFFSVEKRRRDSFAKLSRPSPSQVLAQESDSDAATPKPAKLNFDEDTVIRCSDSEELITEDDDKHSIITEDETRTERRLRVVSSSSEDDQPLLSIGREYLSPNQFQAVSNWVVDSPTPGMIRRELDDNSINDLLKSDSEDVTPKRPEIPKRYRNTPASESRKCKPKLGSNLVTQSSNITEDSLSQGTSKAAASYYQQSMDVTSQGTSKAGANWTQQEQNLEDTIDDFDKMVVTPKLAGEEGTCRTKSVLKSNKSSETNNHSVRINVPVKSKSKSKLVETESNNSGSNGAASNNSKSSGRKFNKSKLSETGETEASSLKLRLSESPTQPEVLPNLSLISGSHSRMSMAGGDSILASTTARVTNLDGAGPSMTLNSSVKTVAGPIDNSVAGAALRVWAPNTTGLADVWGNIGNSTVTSHKEPGASGSVDNERLSSASEAVEKEAKKSFNRSESSSDDEAYNRFISKIKSTAKKKVETLEDDPDFIVPDGVGDDSDEFSSPHVSLKDKILKKAKTTTTRKLPKKTYKDHSSSSNDSLPDIDSPQIKKPPLDHKETKTFVRDSSDTDSEKVSKPGGRKTKASIVISSDSDEEPFVNIYSPKYYGNIPPPSNTKVPKTAPSKTKKPTSVRGGKVSPKPEDFKTPVRPSAFTSQMKKVAADTPTLTFLSSLTQDTPNHRCHPEALRYGPKNFNKTKTELARRLHELYNREIFSGALPEDMKIDWNIRLTKTAGLCYSRREKRKNVEIRSARIELSTKVIDSADRLRDTLVHEMCHAASWVVSGYRDGHGPLWRHWAELAMKRFPELPVIDRCHSYAIRTKYSYRCENCGYTIGRHSKSLDTDRKVCGHCHGRFLLVVNGKQSQAKRVESKDDGESAAKIKTPNPFAIFVKENYKQYKEPGVKHGDVMKILSAKFAETKISK